MNTLQEENESLAKLILNRVNPRQHDAILLNEINALNRVLSGLLDRDFDRTAIYNELVQMFTHCETIRLMAGIDMGGIQRQVIDKLTQYTKET